MDFSSDVVIEFGLNLAGYIIITLLIYTLSALRRYPRTAATVDRPINLQPSPRSDKSQVSQQPAAGSSGPTFIPILSSARVDQVVGDQPLPGKMRVELTPEARLDNRRAIYREARRLLAQGKSRGDLLGNLPLTEDEIDMLSMAGNA